MRCLAATDMNCANIVETESSAASACCPIRLPMGLLGFEKIKDYLLIVNPAEEPFRWLQVKNDEALAFVVVNPFLIAPEYQPDIPQADVEFLGLSSPSEAALYNIVTLHAAQNATINLKGPIVINRNTGIGKQVVIANAAEYSVRHPLPASEAVA
jgi:flagellar assembly factor FliW